MRFTCDPPPQSARSLVRRPDLAQEAGGKQLRERARVELVRLGRLRRALDHIALDVHRDFCQVAIALEATGNALAIARVIEPHVARVVLANPK